MAILFRTIWRAIISSHVAFFLIIVLSLVQSPFSNAQNFDPELDDKTYLNNIEKNISAEVNKTRVIFYKQAVLLDGLAKQFVAAQLKENLFIALRVLAEKELTEEILETTTVTSPVSSSSLKPNNRTKRQDDGDEDGDDGDAAAAAAGIPNRPTIPPQIGLLPQVANLVRVIFGGNGNVNLTSYVASASKLLPRPVGNQVLGIVKILSNANNANRNSFTTANPLLNPGLGPNGLPSQNLNLKSPVAALGGLSPEQILALPNAAEILSGLTPEQLSIIAAAGGVPAQGPNGPIAVNPDGIPPGLTANDIAALAALGVPGLPLIDITPAPLLRSTRKPRPQYSQIGNNNENSYGNNNGNNYGNNNGNNYGNNNGNNYGNQNGNNYGNNINNQQQLPPPPTSHQQPLEQSLISPTLPPSRVHIPQIGQSPQFISAEKDILPLNLNPSMQTLSELQQQLLVQQNTKYKETPQSPSQVSLFRPQNIFNNQQINLQQGFNPGQLGASNIGNGNNLAQQQSLYKPKPGLSGGVNKTPGQLSQQSILKPQLGGLGGSGGFGQQLQNHQKFQINQNSPNRNTNGQNNNGASGPASGSNLQQESTLVGSNKLQEQLQNRRPQTTVQQQQAQLQAQQLQQLQLLQQQEAQLQANKDKVQQSQQTIQNTQFQQPPVQNTQSQQSPAFPPPFPPQQQFQQNPQQQFQQNPQQQFQPNPQQQFQQNSQQFQQNPQQQFQQNPQQQFQKNPQQQFQPNPQQQLQQRPQQQFGQPPQTEFQQLFNQPTHPRPPRPQRPRPTPPNEEEESEEDDAETDFDNRGRQFNLFQNIFPAILGAQNNNNNNNNNNNVQPQQNNVNPPGGVTDAPGMQGNGTITNQNQNNGFDLNMFATNLQRGIGDVIRVMPDLFRGAREGLQLIQALSSILRAFPGLADALPIF